MSPVSRTHTPPIRPSRSSASAAGRRRATHAEPPQLRRRFFSGQLVDAEQHPSWRMRLVRAVSRPS